MSRRWGWTLGVFLLGLVACGRGQESEATRRVENTVPVQTATVRVRLLEEVPGLDALLDAFEAEQGVRVELLQGALADRERPDDTDALREVRVADLGWLGPSQMVRPWSDPTLRDAVPASLAPAGTWEDRDLGIPWRMEATILLGRRMAQPTDWPALGRALGERGWGFTSPACAVDLFTALLCSNGGALRTASGEVVLDSPAAVEALSFLTGLVETSGQADPADRFAAGQLGVVVTDLGGAFGFFGSPEWIPMGIPVAEADSAQHVLLPVRPTVLVQPSGGPHRDLVPALVRRLQQPDVQALIASTRRWAPVSSRWEPSDPFWTSIAELRTQAVFVPALSGGRKAGELILHAVDQALTSKRSPFDALADAQQSFLTESLNR